MDLGTIHYNHSKISQFFSNCKEPGYQISAKAGCYRLGVQGDRIVIVKIFIFCKIVNFFRGITTDAAKVEAVFNLTEKEFKLIEKKNFQDAYSLQMKRDLAAIAQNEKEAQAYSVGNAISGLGSVYSYATSFFTTPTKIVYEMPVKKTPGFFQGIGIETPKK